jgi:hypothetical protein
VSSYVSYIVARAAARALFLHDVSNHSMYYPSSTLGAELRNSFYLAD